MSHQSEAALENALILQLRALGYASVKIQDGAALVANLKSQLGAFNNTVFSEKEFDNILNHLSKGNIFEKAKTLRDIILRRGSIGTHEDLGYNCAVEVTNIAGAILHWSEDRKIEEISKFKDAVHYYYNLNSNFIYNEREENVNA